MWRANRAPGPELLSGIRPTQAGAIVGPRCTPTRDEPLMVPAQVPGGRWTTDMRAPWRVVHLMRAFAANSRPGAAGAPVQQGSLQVRSNRRRCSKARPRHILLLGLPHTTGPSSGAAVASASSICPFCRGTGLCHRCGGKGSVRTLRSRARSCRECGGSGKCALCGGAAGSDWRKPDKGGGGK